MELGSFIKQIRKLTRQWLPEALFGGKNQKVLRKDVPAKVRKLVMVVKLKTLWLL